MSDTEEKLKARERIVTQLSKSLLKESERGCAILSAELIDEHLSTLLRSFMRNGPSTKSVVDTLFRAYGPVSTFAARLQVAFALKLISRYLYEKIDALRLLRNEFAHQWGPVDFDDPKCRELLGRFIGTNLLESEDKNKDKGEKEADTHSMFGDLRLSQKQVRQRLKFSMVVAMTVADIMRLESYIRQGKDIRSIIEHGEQKGRTPF